MARFQANPVIVDAFEILSVSSPVDVGYEMKQIRTILLDSGEYRNASAEMTSRYVPTVGDYWVVQEDGYEYLNPKAVFERKYRPATTIEESADNT